MVGVVGEGRVAVMVAGEEVGGSVVHQEVAVVEGGRIRSQEQLVCPHLIGLCVKER